MLALVAPTIAQGLVWEIEIVDSPGRVGEYTSLALDGSGYPHLSYYDDTNGDLKYAYRDASGWHIETPDEEGNVGRYTSIALGDSGHVHISYYDLDNHAVIYACRDASGWRFENPDPTAWVNVECTSVAIDSLGFAHISYQASGLKYAWRALYGWQVEPADGAGAHSSIAVDSLGRPHISHYDYDANSLKYSHKSGSEWQHHYLDGAHQQGYFTSLALDGADCPHISYRSALSLLRYAYCNSTGWHIVTVDSIGTVGSYSSLALDNGGHPHISYYDETNRDLKYAYRDDSGWHTVTVDAPGSVGYFTSLAVDGAGSPHISYFDGTNQDLKYAVLGVTASIDLTGIQSGGELVLSWTAVGGADGYWVYGDELAYFGPGLTSPYAYRLAVLPPGTTTWSSANGIGDPDHNWTYLVLAVDAVEQLLGSSNRFGEHDFWAPAGRDAEGRKSGDDKQLSPAHRCRTHVAQSRNRA